MSDSVLPPEDDRNREDQLFDLLHNKELDWHLDDELLRVIEQLATPVEGEEEFRESLRARLVPIQSPPETLSFTLGQYVANARGRQNLANQAKRLGLSSKFLHELEADQIAWQGLIQALPASKLARLIVGLQLDVTVFIKLLFTQKPATSGPTLARTATDLSQRERADLQHQVGSDTEQPLSPEAPEVKRYVAQLQTEVQRLRQINKTPST